MQTPMYNLVNASIVFIQIFKPCSGFMWIMLDILPRKTYFENKSFLYWKKLLPTTQVILGIFFNSSWGKLVFELLVPFSGENLTYLLLQNCGGSCWGGISLWWGFCKTGITKQIHLVLKRWFNQLVHLLRNIMFHIQDSLTKHDSRNNRDVTLC